MFVTVIVLMWIVYFQCLQSRVGFASRQVFYLLMFCILFVFYINLVC